jgi:hypothetical protein
MTPEQKEELKKLRLWKRKFQLLLDALDVDDAPKEIRGLLPPSEEVLKIRKVCNEAIHRIESEEETIVLGSR